MFRTPQNPLPPSAAPLLRVSLQFWSALATAAMLATTATAGSGTRPRPNAAYGSGSAPTPSPAASLEGSLWEYQGKLDKGTLAVDEGGDGGDEASIAGTFRLQQGGVFAVGEDARSPGEADFDQLFADFRKSRAENQQSPLIASDDQPQRIGAYKLGKSNRLTLTFDDASEGPTALQGVMALRPRRGSADVFIGKFREKEGKKTIRTWQITVQRAP